MPKIQLHTHSEMGWQAKEKGSLILSVCYLHFQYFSKFTDVLQILSFSLSLPLVDWQCLSMLSFSSCVVSHYIKFAETFPFHFSYSSPASSVTSLPLCYPCSLSFNFTFCYSSHSIQGEVGCNPSQRGGQLTAPLWHQLSVEGQMYVYSCMALGDSFFFFCWCVCVCVWEGVSWRIGYLPNVVCDSMLDNVQLKAKKVLGNNVCHAWQSWQGSGQGEKNIWSMVLYSCVEVCMCIGVCETLSAHVCSLLHQHEFLCEHLEIVVVQSC